MYSCPTLFGTADYLKDVDTDELNACADHCLAKDEIQPDDDLHELVHLVMNENQWTMPVDVYSAAKLYTNVRCEIVSLLDLVL